MAKKAKPSMFRQATQGLRRTFVTVFGFIGDGTTLPWFEEVQVWIDDKTKTPHLINSRTGAELQPAEWKFELKRRANLARKSIARGPRRSARGGTAFGGPAYAFCKKGPGKTWNFAMPLRNLGPVMDDLLAGSDKDYRIGFDPSAIETKADREADAVVTHAWLKAQDC